MNRLQFLRRVEETIRRYGMISPGEVVVAAVSGGPDSVALLYALYWLRGKLDISIHVAHLDHMFRGEESAGDAEFVGKICAELGLPATIESRDVPAFIRETGLSEEEGARIVRYRFLEEVAERVGSGKVATGHTATDQAETVLMRLLRGSGLRGLSGIPPVRRGKVTFIRPLIRISRREIEELLKAEGIPFRIDSSNLKPVYTRNRIRLELMPLLREFNPRIEEILARAGEISAEEDELMERLAIEKLGELALERKEGFVRLRGDELAGLPVALRRRVVRAAVREVKGDLLNIDFDHIESILDLISSPNPNLKLDLPGLRAERRYSELIITSEPEGGISEYEYRLPIPGEVEIPEAGLKLIAEVHEERPPMPKNPDAALLDYDKLSPPLVVRNRRPGDRFRPLGMKGSKKVKDFFIDIKLPLPERDRVPILVSGGQIAWIVGHRIDDRFKVTGETKRFALIKAVRCGDGRRDTG